jgi:isoquinoline 1-oxidoreductase beta subunit
MEPMNCTAKITKDRAEVWVATQNGEGVARGALRGVGTPARQVRRGLQALLGGGFGRRGGAQDYVRQAVDIAKQFRASRSR